MAAAHDPRLPLKVALLTDCLAQLEFKATRINNRQILSFCSVRGLSGRDMEGSGTVAALATDRLQRELG
jgi:hypothetical protein